MCVAGIRDIPDTASLVGTQEDFCYELGDGGITKSNEISVLSCVLFIHFHREPGLAHLHSAELEPTLHQETLEGWHHTREQGTRALGEDNALASADETRVFRWIQLPSAS